MNCGDYSICADILVFKHHHAPIFRAKLYLLPTSLKSLKGPFDKLASNGYRILNWTKHLTKSERNIMNTMLTKRIGPNWQDILGFDNMKTNPLEDLPQRMIYIQFVDLPPTYTYANLYIDISEQLGIYYYALGPKTALDAMKLIDTANVLGYAHNGVHSNTYASYTALMDPIRPLNDSNTGTISVVHTSVIDYTNALETMASIGNSDPGELARLYDQFAMYVLPMFNRHTFNVIMESFKRGQTRIDRLLGDIPKLRSHTESICNMLTHRKVYDSMIINKRYTVMRLIFEFDLYTDISQYYRNSRINLPRLFNTIPVTESYPVIVYIDTNMNYKQIKFRRRDTVFYDRLLEKAAIGISPNSLYFIWQDDPDIRYYIVRIDEFSRATFYFTSIRHSDDIISMYKPYIAQFEPIVRFLQDNHESLYYLWVDPTEFIIPGAESDVADHVKSMKIQMISPFALSDDRIFKRFASTLFDRYEGIVSPIRQSTSSIAIEFILTISSHPIKITVRKASESKIDFNWVRSIDEFERSASIVLPMLETIYEMIRGPINMKSITERSPIVVDPIRNSTDGYARLLQKKKQPKVVSSDTVKTLKPHQWVRIANLTNPGTYDYYACLHKQYQYIGFNRNLYRNEHKCIPSCFKTDQSTKKAVIEVNRACNDNNSTGSNHITSNVDTQTIQSDQFMNQFSCPLVVGRFYHLPNVFRTYLGTNDIKSKFVNNFINLPLVLGTNYSATELFVNIIDNGFKAKVAKLTDSEYQSISRAYLDGLFPDKDSYIDYILNTTDQKIRLFLGLFELLYSNTVELFVLESVDIKGTDLNLRRFNIKSTNTNKRIIAVVKYHTKYSPIIHYHDGSYTYDLTNLHKLTSLLNTLNDSSTTTVQTNLTDMMDKYHIPYNTISDDDIVIYDVTVHLDLTTDAIMASKRNNKLLYRDVLTFRDKMVDNGIADFDIAFTHRDNSGKSIRVFFTYPCYVDIIPEIITDVESFPSPSGIKTKHTNKARHVMRTNPLYEPKVLQAILEHEAILQLFSHLSRTLKSAKNTKIRDQLHKAITKSKTSTANSMSKLVDQLIDIISMNDRLLINDLIHMYTGSKLLTILDNIRFDFDVNPNLVDSRYIKTYLKKLISTIIRTIPDISRNRDKAIKQYNKAIMMLQHGKTVVVPKSSKDDIINVVLHRIINDEFTRLRLVYGQFVHIRTTTDYDGPDDIVTIPIDDN